MFLRHCKCLAISNPQSIHPNFPPIILYFVRVGQTQHADIYGWKLFCDKCSMLVNVPGAAVYSSVGSTCLYANLELIVELSRILSVFSLKFSAL